MAMPKEIMGCKASCSIFVADTKPAIVSGPKVLQTDCRTRMPMEMIRNWTAMGRPRRKCCQAKGQSKFQSARVRRSMGKRRRMKHRQSTADTAWAMTRAMAEPGTPQPKATMNNRARAIFKRDDTIRK